MNRQTAPGEIPKQVRRRPYLPNPDCRPLVEPENTETTISSSLFPKRFFARLSLTRRYRLASFIEKYASVLAQNHTIAGPSRENSTTGATTLRQEKRVEIADSSNPISGQTHGGSAKAGSAHPPIQAFNRNVVETRVSLGLSPLWGNVTKGVHHDSYIL
jgi:hypothetical protein